VTFIVRLRTLVIAGVLVMPIFVAVSCGAKRATLSADGELNSYLNRANALCSRYNGKVRALATPRPTPAEQLRIARQTDQDTVQEANSLLALSRPSQLAQLGRVYIELRAAAMVGEESTRLFAGGRRAEATRAAGDALSRLRTVNADFTRVGLAACAS
jgi:hypothetical protein